MASQQNSENWKNGVFTQWLHKEAGVPDCTLTCKNQNKLINAMIKHLIKYVI
jgi:hypothetical protein